MKSTDLVVPGRSCMSCKYYTPPAGIGMGECHRFPPNLFSIPVEGPNGFEFHNIVGFSQVNETMWCGEHKPKLSV